MTWTKICILSLAIFLASMLGCIQKSVPSPSSNSETKATVDAEKARTISDAIVDNVIKDRREDLRGRMEKGFRDYYDEKSMGSIIELMFDTYGKPLEAEYKIDEAGWKTGSGAYSKPVRKFWYAVRTTKYEKGTHFITVEIVPDEGGLACSSFAIVNFPVGVPDNLQ